MTDKTLEQIDAEMKALEKQREEKLAEKRHADFEDVKAKIKLHGFTKTSLRSAFPTKRKPSASKKASQKAQ